MPKALTWRYVGGFGPDYLKLVEDDLPRPGPGEVLLDMRAASLNFRDLAVMDGRMGARVTPPLIPLSDGVGIVTAVGDGVDSLALADRVTPGFFQTWQGGPPPAHLTDGRLGGPRDGVLSTHRLFPAETLVLAPAHLTDTEAATLPCAGVTAWSALTEPQPVQPGESVLIHGSGGVALFALSLAKAMGATCVMTTSTKAKAAHLTALGADAVILRDAPDWSRQAVQANAGKFPRVVELGGAATLSGSVRATRPGGVVLLIGNVSGSMAQLDLAQVLTRRLTLASVSCGPTAAHLAFVTFIAKHKLRPIIGRVFPFHDATAAFAALRAGRHFGKLCIQIG